jgi:hypothetical protein
MGARQTMTSASHRFLVVMFRHRSCLLSRRVYRESERASGDWDEPDTSDGGNEDAEGPGSDAVLRGAGLRPGPALLPRRADRGRHVQRSRRPAGRPLHGRHLRPERPLAQYARRRARRHPGRTPRRRCRGTPRRRRRRGGERVRLERWWHDRPRDRHSSLDPGRQRRRRDLGTAGGAPGRARPLPSGSASQSPTSRAAMAAGARIRRSSPKGCTRHFRERDVENGSPAPTYS